MRTLGRSFARLAEWQMGLLAQIVDLERMDLDEIRAIMTEVTPAIESLQSYVWRRHTLSAASRMLLAARPARTRRSRSRPGRPAPPWGSASPTSSTSRGRVGR